MQYPCHQRAPRTFYTPPPPGLPLSCQVTETINKQRQRQQTPNQEVRAFWGRPEVSASFRRLAAPFVCPALHASRRPPTRTDDVPDDLFIRSDCSFAFPASPGRPLFVTGPVPDGFHAFAQDDRFGREAEAPRT